MTVAGSGNTTTAATAAANVHGAPSGDVVTTDGSGNIQDSGIQLSAISGTVTSVSAGTLSPIFTTSVATPTSTPAISFALTNAGGGTVLGNPTTSAAGPSYTAAPVIGIPGTSTGTLALASSTASGKFTITAPASASTPTLTLPTTANVLAGQLAGDGTIFSASLATASAAGTLTLPTPSNQTANTVFAGPTSGGAAAPTFRAVVSADIPAGTVTWDAIGSAAGNLSLSNAGNTTTFSQTSAVAWKWDNTNTATSGTTNGSPSMNLIARYWTGAASATDTWTFGTSLAAGTNGASTLLIAQAGSTGTSKVTLPRLGVTAAGTAATCALQFATAGAGWGFYSGTGSRVSFSTNGTTILEFRSGINFSSAAVCGWTSAAVPDNTAQDVAISRLGAASLALGNGTSGDFTGALKLTTLTLQGLVGTYNGIATVSGGVPSELATADLTAQTAAKAATTIYATTATGMYRISWAATITTAGTTSVLGGTNGFQVIYTSPTDSVVKTTVSGNSVTSAANTTGTAVGGTEVVYAKTGTNIQYQYDYTSTGTAMAYELHVKIEAM